MKMEHLQRLPSPTTHSASHKAASTHSKKQLCSEDRGCHAHHEQCAFTQTFTSPLGGHWDSVSCWRTCQHIDSSGWGSTSGHLWTTLLPLNNGCPFIYSHQLTGYKRHCAEITPLVVIVLTSLTANFIRTNKRWELLLATALVDS